MKKIAALIALLLCAASGTAFAVDFAAGADIKAGLGATATNPIAKLSTGVSAVVTFDNSSYAAATKHQNGTKAFGSSAGDTRIYSKESTTATPGTLSASDSSNFTTAAGWTSL